MSPSRQGDRRQVSIPASVQCGGRTIRDVVKDVSPSGLYLQADRHRFRAGERVRISFSLPVAGRLVPIVVDGRVARISTDRLHRTTGIGVQLVNPRAETIEILEAYAEARAREAAEAGRAGANVAPDGPGASPPPPVRDIDTTADTVPGLSMPGFGGTPEWDAEADPEPEVVAERRPDPFAAARADARLAPPAPDDDPTETSTWEVPDGEATDPGFTVIEDDDD